MRGQQYTDILERWTLDDVCDANDVIDAIEDAQARTAAAQRSTSKH